MIDFRLPIQYVLRPHLDFRGFSGSIASGSIRCGEEVLALPSMQRAHVKEILESGETNEEAFAGQAVACVKELGLDEDKVNVNGGAVGLGHPLAATGTRLTLTLAHELKRSGGKYGIATACIGGGQGIAIVIEAL